MAGRTGTPTTKKIFDYWSKKRKELGPTRYGWGIDERECFACGNIFKGLHKAHIIPFVYLKSNDVSNMQLLCPICHSESEGIPDYFKWLHWKRLNEWIPSQKHFDRMCAQRGIDVKKETSDILSKEEYSNELVERYTKNLFQRLGLTYGSNSC